MANDDIPQMLGRIEGKLDQVILQAAEHREDDTRRFTDVYGKLAGHAEDINKAKGAKGALLCVAGVVAALAGTAAAIVAKAFGLH